jgi:DNA adenine methylase
MEPIIKWTGGKSREFKYISAMIPPFKTYVEPFFGGGGIFFSVKPKKAVINDKSSDLMNFYRYVKGEKNREKFKKELTRYADEWENIDSLVALTSKDFMSLYQDFKDGKVNEGEISGRVSRILEKHKEYLAELSDTSFYVDAQGFHKELLRNLASKLKRIRKIEIKEGRIFSKSEMMQHIETAIRSGFYMHFRNILNNSRGISDEKAMANYYFVREFCYGSMFRFNDDGGFNIPYGGIGYNRKNFRKKVDTLFSKEVHGLFKNTILENMDFGDFFKKHSFTREDFIFFDPPYDSDFSEYDLNEFTKDDQKRLAKVILGLDAKFILIIKNTPFIQGLYHGHKGINISSFKKNYMYNVRGRNARETEHLIVHNIDNGLNLYS